MSIAFNPLSSLAAPLSTPRARRWGPQFLFPSVLALGLWILAPGAASANRFGPPWESEVTANQTIVYKQPDRSSDVVGPLAKGAIVVVLAEVKGADGSDWTAIPDGFVASSDITEKLDPWIADVTAPSVSIYAFPDAKSAIRRTARKGDLLRVTGVSPGLNGDTGTWWATTEGFVGLHTIEQATSDWAKQWTLPSADDAANGWWGGLRSQANVRAGPTTQAPTVGTLVPGDRVKVLAEVQGQNVQGSATWYRIDGGRYAGAYVHSSLIAKMPPPKPNTSPLPPDAGAPDGPYIVVDRSAASLTYVDGGQPKFVTYVSLGRAGVETPNGVYGTMGKYVADRMTSTSVSNADHSYDLPNVPFTEYYKDGGYAIHGTYWHDQFGLVESQGCINVTWADSAYLFNLTQPQVASGDIARWTSQDQATPVLIVG